MKINQCQQNYKMDDLSEKNNQNVLSSPKARKFARELGIDVRDVAGSERLGRVIEKDIKEFVSSKLNKKENIKNILIIFFIIYNFYKWFFFMKKFN